MKREGGMAETKRPPGRPQSRALDDAIVAAAAELLGEMSLAALSMELVAQRAGVGKPTVYRRWPTKGALVVEVLARTAPPIEIPPDGDPRERLCGAVVGFYRSLVDSGLAHVLYGLIGETLVDQELAALFRRRYLEPRVRPITDAVRRAITEGVVRADLDVSLVHHLFFGPLMHSWLVGERPMSEQQATALCHEIWTMIITHREELR
jgi:AcrR family transcriptional regulator